MKKLITYLMCYSCLVFTSLAQTQTHIWNFDAAVSGGKVEGWNIYQYTNSNTASGILNLTMPGANCNINLPVTGGSINPATSTQVIIRMKNNFADRRARFYWSTTVHTNVFVDFWLESNATGTGFREYKIDLSNDPRWTGTLTNIRFDVPHFPSSYGSTINVDYVKLTTTPPLPTMPSLTNQPFGVNLAGAEFDAIGTTDYKYPHSDELEYFKSKGLKLVRLPFKWERIQPQINGSLDLNELSRMRNFVSEARLKGMWVLLDMHNYGRRYSVANSTEYIIGSTQVPIASVGNAWRRLAAEFKSFGNIWGYGLMNEPHDMLATAPWRTIAQRIIDSIRVTDLNTTLVVGGNSWSSAAQWQNASDTLKSLVDPSNKIIYEAHMYMDFESSGNYDQTYDQEGTTPLTGVSRIRPFLSWLVANNKKGFLGEYGVPHDDPRYLVTLENTLHALKENGVNGTYWAAGPKWGTYSLSVEPANGADRPQMAVLDDYLIANLPPPSGAHAYWTFNNDKTGTTIVDAWGGKQGTMAAGVTRVTGKIDKGLKFDGGANGFVTLPNNLVNTLNNFTISAWVKMDAVATWQRVFDFGSDTNSYMFLTVKSGTNQMRYGIKSAATTEKMLNATANITAGTWYHLAVTQSSNTATIYLNGAQVGQNTSMTTKPSNLGNTILNQLGKSKFSTNPNFNGIIDDFKIYNRSLSATEIQSMYSANSALMASAKDNSFLDLINDGASQAAASKMELSAFGVGSELKVEAKVVNAGKFQLLLRDLSGRIIHSYSRVAEAGSNSLSFPVGVLADGLYVVTYRSNSEEKSIKVLLGR